jgi:HJR/Mrr/RecB family endonuclease
MKHADLLVGEGLDSYESFYRLLFQQLQSFHQENLHLKQSLMNEQFKSLDLEAQIEKSNQLILSLQSALCKSSLDFQEIQFQYNNLQELSIGRYEQENMNLLLDEINELKQQLSQSEAQLILTKNLNMNLEMDFSLLEKKYQLIVEEHSLLDNQLQEVHLKYQNESYENFIQLFEVFKEKKIDLQSEVQWSSSSLSVESSAGKELTITPSRTSPASLLIHFPSSSSVSSSSSASSSTLATLSSSSHAIFLVTPPSTPLTQQIYHQIINFPLNGSLFESFIALLFQCHGYRSSLRPHSYDHGIDIDLVDMNPMKVWKGVVQCKQYTYKIGSHLIREFIGSMLSDGCHSGYLVTTSYYTREAYKAAEVWRQRGNHLELWDMTILLEKIAPFEERLMQGIDEMRRRGRWDDDIATTVTTNSRSEDLSEYVRVQRAEEREDGEAERGHENICMTRGDRIPSPPSPFPVTADDEIFFPEEDEICLELSQLMLIPSPSSVPVACSSTPPPLPPPPPRDENIKCSPNQLQHSMAPVPTSASRQKYKYGLKKYSPSTPSVRVPSSSLSPSPSLTIPLPTRQPNTSPKRVRTIPFTPTGSDKESDRFSWTVEETNALAQLIIRFSQNASHRVNWGQMECWLKLSEGKNDPIGKLIREEHKDKEKLRSKWKNETRMKATMTTM